MFYCTWDMFLFLICWFVSRANERLLFEYELHHVCHRIGSQIIDDGLVAQIHIF